MPNFPGVWGSILDTLAWLVVLSFFVLCITCLLTLSAYLVGLFVEWYRNDFRG